MVNLNILMDCIRAAVESPNLSIEERRYAITARDMSQDIVDVYMENPDKAWSLLASVLTVLLLATPEHNRAGLAAGLISVSFEGMKSFET
jgi:hypothetical protein